MPRAKPIVVHEDELPYEQWKDSAAELRWRTLLSGNRTPTIALTLGVAEVAPGCTREFRPHRHAQPELYVLATDSFDDVVYGFEAPVPIVEPDPSR